MAVKNIKPTTPGQRGKIAPVFDNITTNIPEKSLTFGICKTGGRNNYGRRSSRYIGGGHKKRFRIIDFLRNKNGIPGIVKTIEYDPNRSARIALIFYKDGEKRYVIAPKGMEVGQEIISGKDAPIEIGNTLPLSEIPLGTLIHNIELTPGRGAMIARSAGTYAQLVVREGKYAVIKLPSGETRKILITCNATIGSVSNLDHKLVKHGKAGRKRWLGRRPRTRGVAMNPVDHPMGGGEGKASGGHPRSRKGLYAKGQPSRKPKKNSDKFIIERRKAKRK